MPFIDNIPKNRLDPLAYLGRNDWLRPTPNGFAADKSRLQEILERSRQYGMGFDHGAYNCRFHRFVRGRNHTKPRFSRMRTESCRADFRRTCC